MLAAHGHGTAIPLLPDQDPATCGGFGYLFPNAPAAPFDASTLPALEALHLDMVETGTDPAADHSSLPAIFTYFGQFVDHDITAFSAQGLTAIEDPNLSPMARTDVVEAAVNARTGAFDLDSLYGRHTGHAALDKLVDHLRFPGDRAKMWLGTFGDPDRRLPFPADPGGDVLRLGHLLDAPQSTFSEADLNALPDAHKSALLNPDGTPRRARAILGDMRNDENLFIAQLHLAFLRFHNRMVDTYPHGRSAGDADAVFAWARAEVRKVYQWLVLNVYLPGICDPAVVRKVYADGPSLYNGFLTACGWSEGHPLPLPLEFTVAAFRFGHSMVRGSYDWNANFGRSDAPQLPEAPFNLMFLFTGGAPTPFGGNGERLPANWGADWDRLVHPISAFSDRSTRAIDTHLARDLTTMTNEGPNPISQNLLARNLRRGMQMNLPTAQAVVEAMQAQGLDVPLMTKAQIRSGATSQELEQGGFVENTPLWFYTLKEAEVLGRGQRLGPVGSYLVADTIFGLIQNAPGSVWKEPGSVEGRWHPVDGPRVSGQLVDSFPALMRAALLMANPDA